MDSLDIMDTAKLTWHCCYIPRICQLCFLMSICHHFWFPMNHMLCTYSENHIKNTHVSWPCTQQISREPLTALFLQCYIFVHTKWIALYSTLFNLIYMQLFRMNSFIVTCKLYTMSVGVCRPAIIFWSYQPSYFVYYLQLLTSDFLSAFCFIR
jgi:hypothetical protein